MTHPYPERRINREDVGRLNLSDGDCILVNGGTTSRHLAEALRGHQNLHIVTNGLAVAMEFARSQNAAVYLLPSTVDFKKNGIGEPARTRDLR